MLCACACELPSLGVLGVLDVPLLAALALGDRCCIACSYMSPSRILSRVASCTSEEAYMEHGDGTWNMRMGYEHGTEHA